MLWGLDLDYTKKPLFYMPLRPGCECRADKYKIAKEEIERHVGANDA